MPTRSALRKARRQVLLSFAGTTMQPVAMGQAKASVHRDLMGMADRAGATRLGPVVWRVYAAQAAPTMLKASGLADRPAALGLVAWLLATPGGVVLVGSLDVGLPPAPRRRKTSA